jgi:large subunit ribosomal protein L10
MLNREDKEKIISNIKQDIEKSQAVFLTNLIGIPSNNACAIRKGVRDAGGKVVITKNSLFGRAGAGTKCEKLFSDLKGANAVAFAFNDAAAVAKVLKDAGSE